MKDIIGGACVGISQVVVGHPLDTIKVLLQNGKSPFGLPLKHYYYGWKFPLLSSMFYNTIAFPVYERNKKRGHYIAGAISGAAVTPIVYILDVAKIKQQMKMPIIFANSRGLPATAAREILATSVYFGSYNEMREKKITPFFAGAGAGLLNWTFTYPIDTIRTRQITQNISALKAYRQGNLWRGFGPCAMRAVIVNGISFSIYDYISLNF